MVPAVPSFSVDDGFWYSLPPSMDHVGQGWLVRVPLGGRRVRGYVIERGERDIERLRPVAAVSGEAPVFDHLLLQSLEWAALHYVSPLASVLERAAPPNVPPPDPGPDGPAPPPPASGRFDDLVESALAGRRHRPVAWVDGRLPRSDLEAAAGRIAAEGGTLCVVAPTSVEVAAIADVLRGAIRVESETDDRETTAAWAQAFHRGGLVVGTPRVAAWRFRRPLVTVAVEDGRRAMKDRQTPTIHVRDLLRARALRERAALLVAGPTPSLEIVAAGAELRRPAGRRRAWSLVEVVDRGLDPPGSGLLSPPAKRAISAVLGRGGRVFVYAHRRTHAAASRCVACRTVRRCGTCGSRPDPGTTCRRCGADLGGCANCGGRRFEPLGAGVGRVLEEVARVVGRDRVEPHPGPAPVTVGTERDLVDLIPSDLVVLVDLDGLVFGTNYRAAEEALRIGARLATRVAPGGRLLVQTAEPEHPVAQALAKGDPEPFLQAELQVRQALGYPPAAELMVVGVRGGVGRAEADEDLRSVAGESTVLGPAETREGWRWLVQAGSLGAFRRDLRRVVQRWRDSGATVRVDADPIDL